VGFNSYKGISFFILHITGRGKHDARQISRMTQLNAYSTALLRILCTRDHGKRSHCPRI